MGTSRIKVIDLSAGEEQIKTSRKRVEHGLPSEEIIKLAKKAKQKAQETEPKIEETEKLETQPESQLKLQKKTKAQKSSKPKAKTRSKRYFKILSLIDKKTVYPLKDAVSLIKKTSSTNFDSTVEAHLVLTNQTRGYLKFPHPFGKRTVALIFADEVSEKDGIIKGNDKTIEEIREGKLVPGRDFQAVYATPEFMPKLASIAKCLGPKGLMPNPKNGTIITDPKMISTAISPSQVEYKTENKAPIIHLAVGKSSQSEKQLEENVRALITSVGTNRIEKAYICSTMGPSIKISLEEVKTSQS